MFAQNLGADRKPLQGFMEKCYYGLSDEKAKLFFVAEA